MEIFANMTATQFCHWFHGFLALENPEFISATQTQIIKDHLTLVFNKVTPDRNFGQYHIPKIPDPFKDVPFAETGYPESLKEYNRNQPDPSKKLLC